MILYDLPFTEALAHTDLIHKEQEAEQRFQAAIHGIDFRASGSSSSTGTLRGSHTRMANRVKQRAGW